VTSVVILIRHQHDPSVPQPLLTEGGVRGILLTMTKPHDLKDFRELLVREDLCLLRLPDIQDFPSQRIHTEFVSAWKCTNSENKTKLSEWNCEQTIKKNQKRDGKSSQTDDAEPSDRESFRRITFRQNQSTLIRLADTTTYTTFPINGQGN